MSLWLTPEDENFPHPTLLPGGEAKTAPFETSQNKTTYQLRKCLFLIVYLKVNSLCLIETTVSVYGPSIVE